MRKTLQPRPSTAIVFVVALIAVLLAPVASAQTQSDVEVRDQLIANQENLLNTYRCLFGVDTGVVPGGCPNPDRIEPGPAPANPTQNDISVRDGLIQNQEALLNVYRCQFDVDTQLVPGGCTGNGSGPSTGQELDFEDWEMFSGENIDGTYVGYGLFGESYNAYEWEPDPFLVVRCDNGSDWTVFFVTEDYIPGEYPDDLVQVSFRITGMSSPVTEQWWTDEELSIEDYGSSVFSLDSAGFVSVLDRNSQGTLFVSITDSLQDTWNAEFTVDGVDAVIAALGRQCRA